VGYTGVATFNGLPGDPQIDEAITVYDRLLLILSEHSMNSEWVKTEIANARQREIREKHQMLFPISLVPFEAIKAWKAFDIDTERILPARFVNTSSRILATGRTTIRISRLSKVLAILRKTTYAKCRGLRCPRVLMHRVRNDICGCT
jgi:TIR domain